MPFCICNWCSKCRHQVSYSSSWYRLQSSLIIEEYYKLSIRYLYKNLSHIRNIRGFLSINRGFFKSVLEISKYNIRLKFFKQFSVKTNMKRKLDRSVNKKWQFTGKFSNDLATSLKISGFVKCNPKNDLLPSTNPNGSNTIVKHLLGKYLPSLHYEIAANSRLTK